MKVWIDRDICEGNLSSCLFCLNRLVRLGVADRACIKEHEPNGSKDMTIFMHTKGDDWEPFVIPKDLVDMVVYQFREGVLGPKIKIEF